MDNWYPEAKQNRAPSSLWGTYSGGPYKGVLHTTESSWFRPEPSTYYGHTSYPHFTEAPDAIYQHIPISRAARALKNLSGGVQTNTDKAIQVEIVATAQRDPAHSITKLTTARKERLRKLMIWIEQQTGIKPTAVTFYDDKSGFTLATPTARQRMSFDRWDNYDAWCGHQHVPENDHWDPGIPDMAFLLTRNNSAQEDFLMAAALDDNDARKAIIRDWFWEYLGRGPNSVEERDLHLWVFSTSGADACLAGITDSKEARDFRAKRGW